ncbi:MAG: hypothetical protein REI94_15015 [Moraxellaceae bacterium]|nr:hypothetical protein [Moraxellaceae bacterium]
MVRKALVQPFATLLMVVSVMNSAQALPLQPEVPVDATFADAEVLLVPPGSDDTAGSVFSTSWELITGPGAICACFEHVGPDLPPIFISGPSASAVPTPATGALAMIGMLALALRRRES